MKNQDLLKKFQVEELEKRYEMGRWVSRVKVGVKYENIEVDQTFDID